MQPVPDLLDRGPRLKRAGVSLLAALAVTAVTWLVLLQIAGSDTEPRASYPYDGGHAARAWGSIGYRPATAKVVRR
jgi:hypothetical protein